ncbi:oligopeptide/dipeptide ABC transporter ATP-binding protein [Streptomyces sp. DW26H14]|uniref:oligopeptide/dipeptide ABC transporter ATP-binding protein n=1 Tax=Streptomyces sp. DW26H14 TaxID=3435395 RepID=UPI00403E19B8
MSVRADRETKGSRRPLGEAVLEVEGLDVTVPEGGRAVRGVSFTVADGESVGLVGESGSGKSLTCRSVLGVLPPGCAVSGGRVGLPASGADLTTYTRGQWNAVRGSVIGAVFQDPASYLNPSLTVGHQLAEALRVTGGLPHAAARARAVQLFDAVGLRDPGDVFRRYPHELSGGMLQRVLIATAVSCEPRLLVADEATTALDVVVQAEILELFQRLREDGGLALLLVTHDLAVVAENCDRVLVMYAGEIVEEGPTARVLAAPAHPYTEALLRVASVDPADRRDLAVIPGRPPRAGADLPGCRFAERCAYAEPRCTGGPVALRTLPDGRTARCLRPVSADVQYRGHVANAAAHQPEGATA